MYRSNYCGLFTSEHIDQEVTLCGWVDRRRDHGGVIFLDLRDREGIVQVVFDPDAGEFFEQADRFARNMFSRSPVKSELAVKLQLTLIWRPVRSKSMALHLEILNSCRHTAIPVG